jgi:NADPH-dependent glutamate synthase beta subunit-like oxidoreductase/2,4-dienoyl-CoA reductase-like NADH-dependent reductase (Old Yellow Enzyme family)
MQTGQKNVEMKMPPWQYQRQGMDDLVRMAAELGVSIPLSDDVSVLAEPVNVGSLTAPNSLVVQPMEGCDGDALGRPADLTVRRYRRFAGGGAGLLWFEAIAVVREARANPRQLWLHRDSAGAFAAMLDSARCAAAQRFGRAHRPLMVAQLTHSGRYSRPNQKPHPLIPQHDPYRDAKMGLAEDWPVLTDDELDRLPEAYAEAAKIAFDVGFDGVDLKSCHGYLINELFACHTREGKYGGAFENRVRLFLDIVDRVRAAVGSDRLITSRMGIYDAIPYPYGWGVDQDDHSIPDLTEPKRLIGQLVERGIGLLNVTVANPYYNPHVNRPFDRPVAGGNEEPEHPLAGVARIISLAGEIQRTFPSLAVVGSGYSWLRNLLPYVGAGAKRAGLTTFVGAGRMAFAYPDFAADIIRNGSLDPRKCCIGCSACTQIMRDGGRTGCVVHDGAVYEPIYRRGRHGNREYLTQLAGSCRQCQDATCRQACPAGIDVPRFLRLFVDGKEREAYEVIREANVFGETCAYLCPVETQCEGSCIEKSLGEGPIPIADVQRYLSQKANREGWSKIRVPDRASGKRVAVIGAGPAGLACAAKLLEAGHEVVVHDRSSRLGGMIDQAIPGDRVGESLAREIGALFDGLPEGRFAFQSNTTLNSHFTLDDVLAGGVDAVFLAVGLSKAVRTSNGTLDGLTDGLAFLASTKQATLDLQGKRVAVIGGGNTAMDAAVSARRRGAEDVYVIYRRSFAEMPAWPKERDRALALGVHFLILSDVDGYTTDGGRLTGVRLYPTRLAEPDASGRRRPARASDEAYRLDMDLVIEAIGQEIPPEVEAVLPGVELQNGRIVLRDGSCQTTRDGVFAGGDVQRGAATVVAAVADGMRAAREIDVLLTK